ncbi:LytR/AlgR family response regulator transcription factor [Mucilaginibacter ginsenosidivorans]|uniref:Response regulator transcription factor n=1 Tax=Mucilaginibacter ginsenosidivorans TaxID=398053 RepID=A0A5B8UY93_9SPHI|nr:response regulator [Mucilaginibacter ginsenosidivorans]QEC63878.1 response regulator transcription factor [Mucilaginibacter ginsenosidivorans]
MSVLKIGIVEDELVIGRTILNTLNELGYDHCGPAISYTEAMEMLEHEKPDLLLLDIQLSGKKDGIDIAEKLNQLYRIPFIFLTANSDGDTIDRAKRVKPHAYIVKPFSREELYAAIEIAFSNFTGGRNAPGAKPQAIRPAKDFMFVRDGYVFKKIFFNDLLYLGSEANYVTLHLKSQKKVMVRSTLNDFVVQLDTQMFMRIHRSYSVNINLVDDVFPTEVAVGGVKIPIGKSYKDDLFKALGIKEV